LIIVETTPLTHTPTPTHTPSATQTATPPPGAPGPPPTPWTTWTPGPPPTPWATTGTPTAPLPVVVLPETGDSHASSPVCWLWLPLLLLGLPAACVIRWRRG
jgi:hypothetical protein